ncbi:MAG TPA: transcriptional regulator, partial [Acidobacteriota bacterium]
MQKISYRTYSFDDFTLELARCCLQRRGAEVKLRPKPFEVLKYLVENRGRLVSKEELIQAIWPDSFVTDDSLVQCLVEVRRALGDDSQHYIKTVPRRGYIFDAAVVVNQPGEWENKGAGEWGSGRAGEGASEGLRRAEQDSSMAESSSLPLSYSPAPALSPSPPLPLPNSPARALSPSPPFPGSHSPAPSLSRSISNWSPWRLSQQIFIGAAATAIIAIALFIVAPWKAAPPERKSIAVLPFKNLSDDKAN